jgi:hypothetical protein
VISWSETGGRALDATNIVTFGQRHHQYPIRSPKWLGDLASVRRKAASSDRAFPLSPARRNPGWVIEETAQLAAPLTRDGGGAQAHDSLLGNIKKTRPWRWQRVSWHLPCGGIRLGLMHVQWAGRLPSSRAGWPRSCWTRRIVGGRRCSPRRRNLFLGQARSDSGHSRRQIGTHVQSCSPVRQSHPAGSVHSEQPPSRGLAEVCHASAAPVLE